MEENSLFPTYDVPDFDNEPEEYDQEYKRSAAWDFEKGDFIRDGANRLVECDGLGAYKAWCLKMSLTERYCCPAYPEEIGVEMEDVLQDPDQKSVESDIERTITEALMVNPRTEYVRGFEFEWDGDQIHCSFSVKGIDTEEFDLSTDIHRS